MRALWRRFRWAWWWFWSDQPFPLSRWDWEYISEKDPEEARDFLKGYVEFLKSFEAKP